MPSPPVAGNSSSDGGCAFPAHGTPSLAWLINPVGTKLFFESYWEKQPLVVKRNQPNYFSPLLSLDEVDRVLTTLDRRYPDVTLKNASQKVTAEDYVIGDDRLDIAKVYQLFGEGSTITLAFLDKVIPELRLFCGSMEREFTFPFQANVYLTPAGAQGAKPHYDTHDVFVLQVAGSKKWTMYGTPLELPLAGQDFDSSVHDRGAPTREFELEAGDMAYIPRGLVHDARSTETVSLHITAGVLRYTWADLLLELVANASLHDSAFRKALPPGFARQGFDRAQARETLLQLIQQAWTESNFEEALDHFVDEFISACPPFLRGQMDQMAVLDCLTADSVVGARTGAILHVRANGDTVSIDCYGRHITFPAHASEAVRFALSHSRFAVRELAGDLDEAGKLAVIRRLMREGLVIVFST
jgi:ribosomal protein L16 Arg81 hydroxylase